MDEALSLSPFLSNEELLGDATKAKTELGWVPKTTFMDLVKEMVAEE